MLCLVYILPFILFQTTIITLFTLTVMKIRTPKFGVTDSAVTNFNGGTTAKPLLNARLNIEICIKNINFGRYSYQKNNRGVQVPGDGGGEHRRAEVEGELEIDEKV
ncbi:hypothetical protein ACS0TY_010231 [Phlomoides rotata]